VYSTQIGESLPPESSRLLQHLHPTLPGRVQNEVASGTHLVCTGNASAWVSSDLQERHSIMNPFGHGLHLGRAAFDEMLRSTVNNNSDHDTTKSFRVVKGRFKGIGKDSACNWVVEADVAGETTTFIARWVIDATGRKASLAKKVCRSFVPSHLTIEIPTVTSSLVPISSRRIRSLPSTRYSKAPHPQILPTQTPITEPR
jgi:hypothetical protein